MLVKVNSVELAEKSLLKSASFGGIDSTSMEGVLLKNSGSSAELRKTISKLVMGLTIGCTPWSTYRDLI